MQNLPPPAKILWNYGVHHPRQSSNCAADFAPSLFLSVVYQLVNVSVGQFQVCDSRTPYQNCMCCYGCRTSVPVLLAFVSHRGGTAVGCFTGRHNTPRMLTGWYPACHPASLTCCTVCSPAGLLGLPCCHRADFSWFGCEQSSLSLGKNRSLDGQ